MTDTLYKRTTTGAVQIWRQEFNPAGDAYRTVSGQIDGKQVTSEWTACSGKNAGRANATSPVQQALLEVTSNYTKKLNQGGYRRSIHEIDDQGHFEPMLAQPYEKYPVQDFITVRWYSQPKLDGIRCIARRSGLWTRQGKPIPTCPHFLEYLEPLFGKLGDTAVFDGEIYADRLADNFNTLVSLAKKQKPTDADLEMSRATLQYHLYDLPSVLDTFAERSKVLHRAVQERNDPGPLRLVETEPVMSQEHLDELYAHYLEHGQEGQMVRLGDSFYENKRSRFLLKRKEFLDAEFEVVGIHEGVGNRSGMAGYVTLRLDGDRTFRATPKGSNADRVEMLHRAADLIGCQATVQYFKLTPDGVPRFPVLKAIHETARW